MNSKNGLLEIGDEIHNLFKGAPTSPVKKEDVTLEPPTDVDGEEFEVEEIADDPGMITDFDDELSRLVDDDSDGGGDVCDDALARIATDMAEYKRADFGRATGIVYEALAELVEKGLVRDMPELDEEPGVKAVWISNAVPKIKEFLVGKGLLPVGGAVGV